MGCQLGPDKGLPVFFFPGTLQTPVGPVPIPRGLKLEGSDTFYRAPGGVYPSMIRVYLSPTLTMGLGVAICFGPQTAGNSIPQPFRDVAGNCIVLATQLPFGGCDQPDTSKGPDGVGGNIVSDQILEDRWLDAADAGSCQRETQYTQTTSRDKASLLVLPEGSVSFSPFRLTAAGDNVNSNFGNPTIPLNSYGFGVIEIDQEPIDMQDPLQKAELKA